MKPKIDKTKFGSITVNGKKYDYDILIRLDGAVEKRQKKLSKEVFGTSHTISLAEAEYVYEKGAEGIIIGSGQSDMSQWAILRIRATVISAVRDWLDMNGFINMDTPS